MIETDRMILRKIKCSDFENLKKMLGDPQVMYAWEKTFSDSEINEWILKQQERYEKDGIGYLLAEDKKSHETIGQIGLLKSNIENETVWEIGYILCRNKWNLGFAAEGARACAEYAKKQLKASTVYCEIRPENNSSLKVAENIGMKLVGTMIKEYDGKKMPHLIFKKNLDV